MAIEWGTMINMHLSTIEFNKNFTAKKWATKIIDINFNHILIIWETRNHEEHGKTEAEIENKKQQRLLEEVRFIISSMQSWSVSDQLYLSETIEELESMSSRHLEIWLTSARLLLQTIRKEAKSRTDNGNSQQKQQQQHLTFGSLLSN